MAEFLLGVDGGGTSTRAVLARADGHVIGSGTAGPSALGQGIGQAWRHIEQAAREAFAAAGLAPAPWRDCALGAGLSGVSNRPWRQAFAAANPGFATVVAETDSYAMLLGAHGGQPGAIVVAGTGSMAEALLPGGERRTVGGWGFPVGDEGSGAWLGMQAMRIAQQALDRRIQPGTLARSLWAECGAERDSLQAWCDAAGQNAYGALAPRVFDAEPHDPAAAQLLARAVQAIETLALAIDPQARLPLAVTGGVGRRLAPRLSPAVQSRLVDVAEAPARGALRLVMRTAELPA